MGHTGAAVYLLTTFQARRYVQSIIQFGSIISYLLASAGNIGWYEAVEERAVEGKGLAVAWWGKALGAQARRALGLISSDCQLLTVLSSASKH